MSSTGTVHPERFDPNGATGKLIDSEHRGRYWWASRVVAGKDVLDAGCGVGYGIEILASAEAARVTGVDIDLAAVEEARSRFSERAGAIVQGDLHDLQLADDSFDVIVCFETIEHLENAERALAEFRRVLRPDGLLLVSSPNPDVYPSGNEHHLHEYRPTELAAAVGEHFSYVTSYRQHAWLASVIEPAVDDVRRTTVGEWREPWEIRRTATLEPGGETFGIIVAGDARLPVFADVVALGSTFEVDWWSEQVANGRKETEKAIKEARREVRRAKNEAREAIAAAEKAAQQQVHAATEQAEVEKREARAAIAAAEAGAQQQVQAASEQIEVAKSEAKEAIAAAEKAAQQQVHAATEQVEVEKREARAAIAAAEAGAQQQVQAASEQIEVAKREAREAIAAAEARARERLQEVENDARHALAQIAEREAAVVKRLRETAAALLDANQELAQIPQLKHRLAELHEEHAQLWARFNEIEGSRSWRLTAPLRRLWVVLGLRP